MKIFTDLLTGKDNKTHDIGRWSWLLSLLSVIGAGAWTVVAHGAVDLMQFAGALSAVSTAHGVAIMAKQGTEPHALTDKPV